MARSESYLETDKSGAYTSQVTRLLRDTETDNCPLLLELIDGGGVNRRLLGYLFGIAVFHPDRRVNSRAMALLQRHAAETTVQQATRLRESVTYHYDEADYLSRYQSAEIDLFDLLLAGKMCLWHRNRQGNGSATQTAFETLDLRRLAVSTLSPALATLDFLKFIALPAHKDFELDQAVPLLQQLPLEVVIIENVRAENFPVGLFSLPGLHTLIIRKGKLRPRAPMKVPGNGSYGSPSLEKLIVDAYPLEGEEQLGPFPKLREALLPRCQIARLDLLAHSPLLERLDASHNQLDSLPAFLSDCQNLRSLKLSGNPFRQISLNLENLLQLEELELNLQICP